MGGWLKGWTGGFCGRREEECGGSADKIFNYSHQSGQPALLYKCMVNPTGGPDQSFVYAVNPDPLPSLSLHLLGRPPGQVESTARRLTYISISISARFFFFMPATVAVFVVLSRPMAGP